MNCRLASELINRRMDGELDRAELAELRAHLASCPICRELDASMGRLGDTLVTLSRANDAALHSEAPVPIRPDRRAIRTLGRRALSGLAAAACVGLMLLAASTVRREPVSTQPAPVETAARSRPPVVRLVGESRKKYLAAEVDSGVQNVRLVYVFPVATRTTDSTTQPAS